jgi:spermidine synthase
VLKLAPGGFPLPAFPLIMLAVFAFTLFCSATLLFMVQPLVGKMILPLLGGSPEVWNTCMVFFQAMLLAGYAYAHAATKYLGIRKQAVLHLVILLIPLLFLPIRIDRTLVHGGANPIASVLVVLLFSVGVPFFVISTSAPLLQKWFSSTNHPSAKDPYFLYGASNLGSMMALLGYPIVVEPLLKLGHQTTLWAIGYGLLVALIAGCCYCLWKSPPAVEPAAEPAGVPSTTATPDSGTPALSTPVVKPASEAIQPGRPEGSPRKGGKGRKNDRRVTRSARGSAATLQPETRTTAQTSAPALQPEPAPAASGMTAPVTMARRLRWILLAAVPSSLMLGATTYITTDIAAIPFLWVLPLALYLLSFIIVFAKVSQVTQSIIVFVEALVVLAVGMNRVYPLVENSSGLVLSAVWVIGFALFGASIFILFIRDDALNHKAMILALPLLVLLVVFMMLSEIKPGIVATVALHLLTLFVVAMVCHGELARDRPAASHLTEFFLLMSVGGVVGGLFNALIAPMIFNSLAEYHVAMVIACLLLPPLTTEKSSSTALLVDLSLSGVFLASAVALILLRIFDPRSDAAVAVDHLMIGVFAGLLLGVVLAGGGAAFILLRHRLSSRIRTYCDWSIIGVLIIGLPLLGYAAFAGNRQFANLVENPTGLQITRRSIQLTDQTLAGYRGNKLPKDVLAGIDDLRGQTWEEDKLEQELNKVVSKENTGPWQKILLYHARRVNSWSWEWLGLGLARSLPAVVVLGLLGCLYLLFRRREPSEPDQTARSGVRWLDAAVGAALLVGLIGVSYFSIAWNILPGTYFKITDGALASLKAEGVPEDVLQKLEVMKDKSLEREPFVIELNRALGKDEGAPLIVSALGQAGGLPNPWQIGIAVRAMIRTDDGKEYVQPVLRQAVADRVAGSFELPRREGWITLGVALLLGLLGGLYMVSRNRGELWASLLDVALPLTLTLLIIGLIFGIYSTMVDNRLKGLPIEYKITEESLASMKAAGVPDSVLAKLAPLKDYPWNRELFQEELAKILNTHEKERYQDVVVSYAKKGWLPLSGGRLRLILLYGLPAILCYTFVERSTRFGLGVGAILLAASFCHQFENRVLMQKRSFFGVLIVETDQTFHRLVHGTTLHGQQFIDPEKHGEPLTYYHRTGPIGQIMAAYNDPDNREVLPKVGLIGLGTGTMACYARKGQEFTFYDIDPLVKSIAQNKEYFTYWSDAVERGAKMDLIINDARLAIERQAAENEALEAKGEQPKHAKYDIMIVDAFSSDAIPIHLITQEALEHYLKMLNEKGLIVFHISNRYLDLNPVLANLGRARKEKLAVFYNKDNVWRPYPGKSSSTWVVLTRDEKNLDRLLTPRSWATKQKEIEALLAPLVGYPDGGLGLHNLALPMYTVAAAREAPWQPSRSLDKVGVWTDDYCNLLSVFELDLADEMARPQNPLNQ